LLLRHAVSVDDEDLNCLDLAVHFRLAFRGLQADQAFIAQSKRLALKFSKQTLVVVALVST
jgi:hypothetical protein